MNDEDFVDAAFMLNMVGIIIRGNVLSNKADDAREALAIAKHMLAVRNEDENDDGIATIKKRKYVRKN